MFNSKLIDSCEYKDNEYSKFLKVKSFCNKCKHHLVSHSVDGQILLNCTLQFPNYYHHGQARVKLYFGNTYYIKFLSCDISFKERNFGIAMTCHAVQIPMTY